MCSAPIGQREIGERVWLRTDKNVPARKGDTMVKTSASSDLRELILQPDWKWTDEKFAKLTRETMDSGVPPPVQFSKGEGKYGQRFNRFRGEGRQLLVIYFWCLAAQSLIASYLFLNWRDWWRAGIQGYILVCTLMLQLVQQTITRMSSYWFRSSRCATLNSQVQACAFKARDCVVVPKAKHFNFRDVAAQDAVDFYFN